MNRDNLTKTSVVDKNGKYTTVYKKLRDLLNPKSKASLQAQPALSSATRHYETFSSVLDSKYNAANRKRATKLLNKHDPSIISTIDELLAKSHPASPDGGTISTRDKMVVAVNDIVHNINYYSYPKSDGPQLSIVNYLENDYLPRVKDNVKALWNSAAILTEVAPYTSLYEADDIASRMIGFHRSIGSTISLKSSDEDAYWRGLALLAYIKCPTDKTAPEFIEWIAGHPDPQKIIALATERNSANVPLLKELSSETGTLDVLTDGII